MLQGQFERESQGFAQEHMGRKLNWKAVENVGLRKLIEQLRHQICHNYNIGERYGVNGDTIRYVEVGTIEKRTTEDSEEKGNYISPEKSIAFQNHKYDYN